MHADNTLHEWGLPHCHYFGTIVPLLFLVVTKVIPPTPTWVGDDKGVRVARTSGMMHMTIGCVGVGVHIDACLLDGLPETIEHLLSHRSS